LVDAAIFGKFKSSNHGLSFTRFGFGARRGLKFILGSWLLVEPLNHEERSKHCENQNDYQRFYPPPFCFGHLFGIVAATNLFFWTPRTHFSYALQMHRNGHHQIDARGCPVDSVTALLSTHPEAA
jgi:hypothetical protein